MKLPEYLKRFSFVEIMKDSSSGDVERVEFRVKDVKAWMQPNGGMATLFKELDTSKLRVAQEYSMREGKIGFLWSVWYGGAYDKVSKAYSSVMGEVKEKSYTQPEWAKKITGKQAPGGPKVYAGEVDPHK